MARIEKKKRYPADLTDEESERIKPLLLASSTGRWRAVDLQEILNAIRYMARSSGGWRMRQKDSGYVLGADSCRTHTLPAQRRLSPTADAPGSPG